MKKDFVFILIMILASLTITSCGHILSYTIDKEHLDKDVYIASIISPLYLGLIVLFIIQPIVKKYLIK